MPAPTSPVSLRATRLGGAALLLAAAGFILVFWYLAAAFDYPDVLEGSADSVLPRLLQLGALGRAAWALYALLPLLLIPAGVGLHALLRRTSPSVAVGALVMSVVAAVAMVLGLARWSTVHWVLAERFATMLPESRESIGALFTGLNTFLGQFIGEFLGELALNAFFALAGLGLMGAGRRRLGQLALAAAALGTASALRNVTALVSPLADLNNVVLPVWLIVLGWAMLRSRDRSVAT